MWSTVVLSSYDTHKYICKQSAAGSFIAAAAPPCSHSRSLI